MDFFKFIIFFFNLFVFIQFFCVFCSEELLYQMLLYNFENFCEIQFETPLSVKELAVLALKNPESGWCEQDGPVDELAENVEEALIQKADMLREYYGLDISSDGQLKALPLILGKNNSKIVIETIYF